jgi:hypothetical protein
MRNQRQLSLERYFRIIIGDGTSASMTGTSEVEVSHISPYGIWLLVERKELFLSFDQFPWFRDASVSAINNVTLPSPQHLYWPDLDIDLAVDSIEHPERFPLVAKPVT